jgi:cytochrome b561
MALHWAVAALIVAQFVLAERAEDLPLGIAKIETLATHKSVGLTILGLAVLRVLWRLIVPPPALPAAVPRWQARASAATHWALYALLFALPLTGWLFSSAASFSVSWWNFVQLPDLVGPDEGLAEILEETHEILGIGLLVLVGVHVAAALKHQFVDRDGVLLRMIPRLRRGGAAPSGETP